MAAMTDPQEKIHIFFKTYLDPGFTGLAENILPKHLTAPDSGLK